MMRLYVAILRFQTIDMMFFTHDLDEHLMSNEIIFMSTNDIAHTVIMLTLFLLRTMPRADIPVYPVKRMNSFDLVSHTIILDPKIPFDF